MSSGDRGGVELCGCRRKPAVASIWRKAEPTAATATKPIFALIPTFSMNFPQPTRRSLSARERHRSNRYGPVHYRGNAGGRDRPGLSYRPGRHDRWSPHPLAARHDLAARHRHASAGRAHGNPPWRHGDRSARHLARHDALWPFDQRPRGVFRFRQLDPASLFRRASDRRGFHHGNEQLFSHGIGHRV